MPSLTYRLYAKKEIKSPSLFSHYCIESEGQSPHSIVVLSTIMISHDTELLNTIKSTYETDPSALQSLIQRYSDTDSVRILGFGICYNESIPNDSNEYIELESRISELSKKIPTLSILREKRSLRKELTETKRYNYLSPFDESIMCVKETPVSDKESIVASITWKNRNVSQLIFV